jgi:hypothetical protein
MPLGEKKYGLLLEDRDIRRGTPHTSAGPPSVIEDMRGTYLRSQEFLPTATAEALGEDHIMREFKSQLLLVAGFKPDELEKMDALGMGDGVPGDDQEEAGGHDGEERRAAEGRAHGSD